MLFVIGYICGFVTAVLLMWLAVLYRPGIGPHDATKDIDKMGCCETPQPGANAQYGRYTLVHCTDCGGWTVVNPPPPDDEGDESEDDLIDDGILDLVASFDRLSPDAKIHFVRQFTEAAKEAGYGRQ